MPNLLVDADRITLIDPAGVRGPAEFDAARGVGRAAATTGPTGVAPMSDRALRSDCTLNSDAFEALLGLELSVEVGYRLDSRADVVALGADPQTFHDDTHQFIRLAAHGCGSSPFWARERFP